MRNNIYIESLEIGISYLENGVSYIELKEILVSKGFSIEGIFEDYFYYWFYKNFFVEGIYGRINQKSTVAEKKYKHLYKEFESKKAFLTGSAHQDYIDYIELKDARKFSKKAIGIASAALVVTLIALIFSIIFNQKTIRDKESLEKLETQYQEEVLEKLSKFYNIYEEKSKSLEMKTDSL